MKRKFLLSIALALMYSVAGAQNSLRQIQMENDTLNEHFIDIIKAIVPQAKEQEVELCIKYKVPKAKFNQLSYYVKERELRKKCYDRIYGDSIFKRVRCKLELDSIYRDSINTILIPIKGSRISGDNISLALFLTPLLQLDEAQYQYFMDKALDMARRIYCNPRINVWNEEIDLLRKILTPTQLTNFFTTKNAESVTKEIILDGKGL